MGLFTKIATGGDPNRAVREGLLAGLLESGFVSGVLVPVRNGSGKGVSQTLVVDPRALRAAEPFAPVVPISGARLAASLTSGVIRRPLAAVLRSCEVRAFLELVKLHQGSIEGLFIVGMDCLGRFENRDFLELDETHENLSLEFLCVAREPSQAVFGKQLPSACNACESIVPDNVDARLCVLGCDPSEQLWIEWVSDKGRRAQAALRHEAEAGPPDGREGEVSALSSRRARFREEHLAAFRQTTPDFAGLTKAVEGCVLCTNCRVACPVCYCRHCVFTTDTFRHDGEHFLRKASQLGAANLPGDSVFYQLTRMVHSGPLCVGCGQCSSACPNGIPVMELMQGVAQAAQKRFGYVPGRSLDEPQPLATFQADEFVEVTGQVK